VEKIIEAESMREFEGQEGLLSPYDNFVYGLMVKKPRP